MDRFAVAVLCDFRSLYHEVKVDRGVYTRQGRQRLCKVRSSPADSRSGVSKGCALLFESVDECALSACTESPQEQEQTSSVPAQSRYHPLQSVTNSAIFRETLQYQGRMKDLIPNLVFDSSSTISIPRLLAGPEQSISIRPRRKRDSTSARCRSGRVVYSSDSAAVEGPQPVADALKKTPKLRAGKRWIGRRAVQQSAPHDTLQPLCEPGP